uniref:BUB1 N-terminal domain-containing protein n=1 Tax=Gouania willdenowi TaxID=441366 RepID=A0A8C5G321_GOUWI
MFLWDSHSHIFNKGVGTKTAAFYVSWARQFEQRGLNQRADGVYQKALENGAQPGDVVLHEYSVKLMFRNYTKWAGQCLLIMRPAHTPPSLVFCILSGFITSKT